MHLTFNIHAVTQVTHIRCLCAACVLVWVDMNSFQQRLCTSPRCSMEQTQKKNCSPAMRLSRFFVVQCYVIHLSMCDEHCVPIRICTCVGLLLVLFIFSALGASCNEHTSNTLVPQIHIKISLVEQHVAAATEPNAIHKQHTHNINMLCVGVVMLLVLLAPGSPASSQSNLTESGSPTECSGRLLFFSDDFRVREKVRYVDAMIARADVECMFYATNAQIEGGCIDPPLSAECAQCVSLCWRRL